MLCRKVCDYVAGVLGLGVPVGTRYVSEDYGWVVGWSLVTCSTMLDSSLGGMMACRQACPFWVYLVAKIQYAWTTGLID